MKKEESSDSSSSDSSDSEEEAPAKKKEVKKKEESSDSSSSDSSDSEDEKSNETKESDVPASKKRKAENTEESSSKRAAVGEDLPDDENPTIYIRGLPWKATAEEVQEFFAECGAIKSVDLPLMGDGRSSGTAIVEFESPEGSAKAMECNGADFGGRWLNIKYSSSKPITAVREPSKKEEGCTTVFVGNLSFQIDEDTLREAFSACGPIASIRFAEDRETGAFKGFGHIEFENSESTDKAVKMAGEDVMGRPIRVDYANDRRGGGGGGRGGGGRGGRGYMGGGRGGGRGGRGRGGGRGGGRPDPSKAKKSGGIAAFSGTKVTFD